MWLRGGRAVWEAWRLHPGGQPLISLASVRVPRSNTDPLHRSPSALTLHPRLLPAGRAGGTPANWAAPAHPYAAAAFADVTAFNRSEAALLIRRSFDALVQSSPIGGHLVSGSRGV